jgi:hypothetical protein
VAAGAGLSSSLLSSGSSGGIWQFIGISQLFSLFALINIPVMPGKLITMFQGLSIASFEFVPNIVKAIPSNETSNIDDSMKLTDNSKYHPSNYKLFLVKIGLKEKSFLNNVGNTILIMAGVGAVFLLLKLFANKCALIRKLKDKMEYCGLLQILISNYLKIILCSCTNIYYVICFL